jgi:hypothetical protein
MRKILVLCIVVLTLAFSACDDTSSTQYYYESFRVLKSNFDSVDSSSMDTLDSIKNYRDRLKPHLLAGSMKSGTNSQTDTYQYLGSLGMTAGMMNKSVSLANTVGNSIAWFGYKYASDYYVIVYIERL